MKTLLNEGVTTGWVDALVETTVEELRDEETRLEVVVDKTEETF